MLEHMSLRDLFRILLALLCFFYQMPGTCAEILLQIDPPSLVVRFGSPASANCSTNATHYGMGWEAAQGSVQQRSDVQLVTWTVERLEEWKTEPICFMNSRPQKAETLKLTIYKPPEQVSISTENQTMFEGSQYELKCEVLDIAPVYLLTVNWYKGQVLVKSVNFSHENKTKTPNNITATLQISPHRSDDGVQYTCEAELNLGPEGPQPPPIMMSDPLNITVYYGPEFSNCPEAMNLVEGFHLSHICEVTGKPFPHSYWEKDGLIIDPTKPFNRSSAGEYNIIVNGNIEKTLVVNVIYGPDISCPQQYTVHEGEEFNPNCSVQGYPSYELSWYKDGDVEFPLRMQRSDAGQYVLTASNKLTSINHTLEIDVLYEPSSISELHSAQVSIGEDVVLKCASNGKPRPIYKWIYHHASNVYIKDQDGVSLLHIIRAGGDNIGTYLCIASNDLGKQSRTVRVEVQGAEPTCPLSFSPNRVLVEYGETVHVECLSSVSNATVRWEFENKEVKNSTLVINSLDYSDWILKATCYGRFVGLDDCQKDLDIIIYKRPEKVSISIKNHTGPLIEGNSYTLQCDVQNVGPVDLLTVNWYKGNALVENVPVTQPKNLADESKTLTIFPSRNDTSYSCEAELRLGEKNLLKFRSDPHHDTVYYKPTIWEKVERRVPVFYGYPGKLFCNASGYPEPTIIWFFDNQKSSGENLTVKEHAGEYTCVAVNSVGNDTRVVSVVMEEDYLPLIAGFVALVVVIISAFFIFIYSIYYKNTKMGHYTVEGAKPKAQNGNVAQNGKDSTIPMKKILV